HQEGEQGDDHADRQRALPSAPGPRRRHHPRSARALDLRRARQRSRLPDPGGVTVARRRKTIEQSPAVEVERQAGAVRREADAKSGITTMTYDASEVIVVDAGDDVWKRFLDEISGVRRPEWAGAFVLVKPPA